MGLIIDTSVFITWERSGRTINFKAWSSFGEVAISAITASELLVGVWRADSEERRLRRSAFVETILSRIPVFDVTTDVARRHAKLFAEMVAKGETIGAHDLLIAATAIHHGFAVLTSNAADFSRVPGLNVLEVVR